MVTKEMIKEATLTGEDWIKFEEDINKHRFNYFKQDGNIITGKEEIRNMLLEIFVMRYKLNLSSTDIAEYYKLDMRSIQLKLSKLGWNRDKFEAQAIATTKRNYKQIKSKSIKTMMKNNVLTTGSEIENYIRYMINQELTSRLNYEIIVGINNRTILENLEIDIPVIVFKSNKIIKFAIEVNGKYWHRDEIRENRKADEINKTSYKYFTIDFNGDLSNNRSKINNEIDKVVNQIIEEVEQTSFFNVI